MLLLCLEVLGERLSCFPGRSWEGVCRKLLSLVKPYHGFWIWNIDQNLNIALLIMAVSTVLSKSFTQCSRKKEPTSQGMCKFSLQNFQNETFKIFKMFKNNMKFIRVACWINSKISKRDKSNALVIFLFCHYCWSLLWCNYWKFLKSDSHISLQRYAQFWFFRKGSGNSISIPFCVWFFNKKKVSYYALLTDQISLPDCLYFLQYWSIYVL